jgi:hypothetical protein
VLEELPVSDPTKKRYRKTAYFLRIATISEWVIVQDLMSKIELNPAWSTTPRNSEHDSPLEALTHTLMDMTSTQHEIRAFQRALPSVPVGCSLSLPSAQGDAHDPKTKPVFKLSLPPTPVDVDEYGFPTVFGSKRSRVLSNSSSLQSITSFSSTVDYSDVAVQTPHDKPHVDDFGFPVFGDALPDKTPDTKRRGSPVESSSSATKSAIVNHNSRQNKAMLVVCVHISSPCECFLVHEKHLLYATDIVVHASPFKYSKTKLLRQC